MELEKKVSRREFIKNTSVMLVGIFFLGPLGIGHIKEVHSAGTYGDGPYGL